MKKRLLSVIVAITLLLTSFPINPSPVQAAGNAIDQLDIGFGGAFSTAYGYTSSTGEIMFGDVTRRSGTEQLVANQGVTLNGGTDGIQYVSQHAFGSTTMNAPFIMEAEFNAQSSQTDLATLLAAMGNLYVRYRTTGTLQYGFSVNNNGSWTDYRKEITIPSSNAKHTIAIVYEPTSSGATLRLFLDGVEQESVVSTNGAATVSTGGANKFAFGNEVHSASFNRGFKGSISRAIVSGYSGSFDPSYFKLMELGQINHELIMLSLGSLDENSYIASVDELNSGNVQVTGGEIVGLGLLNLSGNQSRIVYTPSQAIQPTLLTNSYAAEISLAPESIQAGNQLIDLAGAVALQVGVQNNLNVVVGGANQASIDITNVLDQDYVHLALAYEVRNQAATISVWNGLQQLGDDIVVGTLPTATHNSIIYAGDLLNGAGKSVNGTVYGVAFGSITGYFKSTLLGLLGGPCILPEGLDPGLRIAISANECPAALAAKASLVRPKESQVQWQQYELTAFLHYGINTYYDVEWGNFNEDPNRFQPTDLDTDQWARTLKESGFKMAILTVKHHDGFLLYPSRYTDFGVESSTWKNGEGDVLREFVDSMRKYDIKVGVYLSPSDHKAYTDGFFANNSPRSMRTIPTLVQNDDRAGDPSYPTFQYMATDYGAFFLNQLYEVLTQYGEIDEVWFDGSQGHIPGNRMEKYDWDSYYSLIRELAPNAVIAVQGEDVRWVGNESGRARENEWSVLAAKMEPSGIQTYFPSYNQPDLGSRTVLTSAAANGMEYLTWWPSEVDVSIRPGWFYHANQSPKSIQQLRDIYYQSVARNSVLLLNIPPDKEGKLPQVDVNRLKEWNQSMKRDFAINYNDQAVVTATNSNTNTDPNAVVDKNYDTAWASLTKGPSTLTFNFGDPVQVDKVVLQENIREGQQIESFAIDVKNVAGEWQQIASNGVVGYKRVQLLSQTVTGSEFRVRILQARGPVHLSEVGFYLTGPSIANKTSLDSLIVEAEMQQHNAEEGNQLGQYPASAKEAFQQAINAAKEVSSDPYATQGDVNGAYGDLENAIQQFLSSPNEGTLHAELLAPASVNAGANFDVKVAINYLETEVFAQDITISYDDSLVEFVNAESLIDEVGIISMNLSTPGTVRLILASKGAEYGVIGTVELLKLQFRALNQAGTTTLPAEAIFHGDPIVLGSGLGEDIHLDSVEVSVTINNPTPVIISDLNGDGRISIGDLALIASHYGKTSASPDWASIQHMDFNTDGVINISDLGVIATQLLNN